jgi:hypothetical protein
VVRKAVAQEMQILPRSQGAARPRCSTRAASPGLGNAFRAEVLHGMRCRRLVPPTSATSRSEQRDLTTRCAIGRARMGRWDAVRAFGTSAACHRASV